MRTSSTSSRIKLREAGAISLMIFLVLSGKSSGRLSEPQRIYIKQNDVYDFSAQDFVCDIPDDFQRAKMNPEALGLMKKIKAFRWKVSANYDVLVLDDCFILNVGVITLILLDVLGSTG